MYACHVFDALEDSKNGLKSIKIIVDRKYDLLKKDEG